MMAFKVIAFFSVLSEAVASMPRRLGKAANAHTHSENQSCSPAGYRQFLKATPVSERRGLRLYRCFGKPRSCQLICKGDKGFGGGSGEIKCTPKQGQKPNYEFVSRNICTKGNTVACGKGSFGAACAACGSRDGATCVLSGNTGVCSSGCCADPAEGLTAPRTTAPRTTTRKPTSNGDVCKLSIAVGRCRALIPSFGFDNKLGRCISFIYGGCGGNENRFATTDACRNKCPGKANKTPVPAPIPAPAPAPAPGPVAPRTVRPKPVAPRTVRPINGKPATCTWDSKSPKWRCIGVPCSEASQCYPPMGCEGWFLNLFAHCC